MITQEELEKLGFYLFYDAKIYKEYRLKNFIKNEEDLIIDFYIFEDNRQEIHICVDEYDTDMPYLNKEDALRLSNLIQILFKE